MVTATAIQRPFQHTAPKQSVYLRKQREKSCVASKRTDSRSFLNQPIEEINLYSSQLKKIKVSEDCSSLAKACRRLFKLVGDGFPISFENSIDNLVSIIEGMEEWASNHNLNFTADKDADDDLLFVLYHEIPCLEMRLFHFFVSPIESLPYETAELYKRFLHFVSVCLDVSVSPFNTDNSYLEMLIWSDIEDPEEESYTSKLYKSDKVKKLFYDVIEADYTGLKEDLLKHQENCEKECVGLVEEMIKGVEILPMVNINNYDFNPFRSYSEYDGVIDLRNTIAFLYSDNDGMSDALEECANSDNYCGLVPQGWNRWVLLSENITDGELKALMRDDSIEEAFLEWSYRFYEKCEIWDRYKYESEFD